MTTILGIIIFLILLPFIIQGVIIVIGIIYGLLALIWIGIISLFGKK